MKQIELSNGGHALVDDEDFELLNQHRWRRHRDNHVHRSTNVNGSSTTLWMHREVLGTPKGMFTDHINGNPLDNRKCNLRVATPAENARNSRSRPNKLGFKGVEKRSDHYKAFITVDNQTINLGKFATPQEAYKAYVDAARKHHGEFANVQCQRMNEVLSA